MSGIFVSTYTPAQIQGMPDDVLDTVYAAAFDMRSVQDVADLSNEILDRLQSVTSFVGGFFGNVRFPEYDKRGTFKQSQVAQESVKENAQAVATTIASTVGSFTMPLIILGIVGIVLLQKLKK